LQARKSDHVGIGDLASHCFEKVAPCDVEVLEPETLLRKKQCQTVMLEARRIIVVQVVDTEDVIAPVEKPVCGMVADEAGCAGQKNFHRLPAVMPCFARRCGKSPAPRLSRATDRIERRILQ
jgi:hypothetical protein